MDDKPTPTDRDALGGAGQSGGQGFYTLKSERDDSVLWTGHAESRAAVVARFTAAHPEWRSRPMIVLGPAPEDDATRKAAMS